YPSRPSLLDRRPLLPLAGSLIAVLTVVASPATAFCGFYVAKAETELFNQASKVVIVRDGDRTVLTMANDYEGDPTEFAMVVPVPTVLREEQIHVGDRGVIEHLDAYTAPRLVEYFDPDPCRRFGLQDMAMRSSAAAPEAAPADRRRAEKLRVRIEAEYTVGEYDVLILSAEESRGLETWLRENGYRIPDGASRVLGSYLRQGMRFFVAKVNLEQQSRLGFTYLRPLQMAFETPKFMLPIRLGTLNARGPQDLFVWTLTRGGRVETTNYRTVRLPTDVELPAYAEERFADVYRAMFDRQVQKERMRTVFLEYAWDMAWCDPCAADPLSPEELRQLGVFWLGPADRRLPARGGAGPQDVFVTRLHLRYTAETFPEDLRFQVTGDRSNFQGRYILHRPWTGSPSACPEARDYFRQLSDRRQGWARNLARLTGWELAEIHRQMGSDPREGAPAADDVPWWKKIWGDGSGP
ncbi:MAG: DUF2330 domain-containing protein, partial [Holophagales bacterium]|nr:DUF2330 domain-containing protein [Holophagales bacterium]